MRLSTIENKLNGLKGPSMEFSFYGFQKPKFGGASKFCATSGEFPVVGHVDLARLSDTISEETGVYFQPQIGYIFLKNYSYPHHIIGSTEYYIFHPLFLCLTNF